MGHFFCLLLNKYSCTDFSTHFYGGFYGKKITLVEYYQDTVQFGSNISFSRDSRRHFLAGHQYSIMETVIFLARYLSWQLYRII